MRANPIDIIKSYIWEVYSFSFKENKYIIVHITDRQVNGFYPYYFSVLFDITDINEIKVMPIGEIVTINNPDYISISQDSLLTLNTWNLSDTIYSYSIDKEGQYIQNNNFLYIYVYSYYEDTARPKTYKIDMNNSKWSNTINNNNDCEWDYLYPDRDNMYTNYPSIEK